MIPAVIAGATLGLAVLALIAWLTHGRIAAGDALVAVRLKAQADLTTVADERDDYSKRWAQAAADLAALTATNDQTVDELSAALEVIHGELSKRLVVATPADAPRIARELLEERLSAMRARRERAARAGGDGDARDPAVPGSGPPAVAGVAEGAGGG